MELQQNATNAENTTPDKKTLDELRIEEYISYVAVGGLITDDDGKISKVTTTEFAQSIGVERTTLHRWKKNIPDFWARVDRRRAELFSKNRMTAVWNGLFLRAAKGDAEQAKIILGVYAKWQPPSVRHEVTVGGLGDLVNIARQQKIIDGEVVDSGHNTTASA